MEKSRINPQLIKDSITEIDRSFSSNIERLLQIKDSMHGSRDSLENELASFKRETLGEVHARLEQAFLSLQEKESKLDQLHQEKSRAIRRIEADLFTMKLRLESLSEDLRKKAQSQVNGTTPSQEMRQLQVIRKKLRKLTRSPRKFFNDSKHPVVKMISRSSYAKKLLH